MSKSDFWNIIENIRRKSWLKNAKNSSHLENTNVVLKIVLKAVGTLQVCTNSWKVCKIVERKRWKFIQLDLQQKITNLTNLLFFSSVDTVYMKGKFTFSHPSFFGFRYIPLMFYSISSVHSDLQELFMYECRELTKFHPISHHIAYFRYIRMQLSFKPVFAWKKSKISILQGVKRSEIGRPFKNYSG